MARRAREWEGVRVRVRHLDLERGWERWRRGGLGEGRGGEGRVGLGEGLEGRE